MIYESVVQYPPYLTSNSRKEENFHWKKCLASYEDIGEDVMSNLEGEDVGRPLHSSELLLLRNDYYQKRFIVGQF